jgi:hypothetical protein
MVILCTFLAIMLSSQNQPTPELFFEFKSQGTYSQQEFCTQVFTDRTVHYKRSKLSPVSVIEEWTGTLSEADYKAFVSEIVNSCKFMDLPQKPDEKIMIKDGSFDDFTVIHNSQKHTIGGYGVNHYGKYKCVYQSYNKMLFSVKNQQYKVKPKS